MNDRVVVLVREGCHLCRDAVETATDVCRRRGVGVIITDVDADPDLRARYTDHVPVTIVDGTVFSYWFLDGARLEQALASAPD